MLKEKTIRRTLAIVLAAMFCMSTWAAGAAFADAHGGEVPVIKNAAAEEYAPDDEPDPEIPLRTGNLRGSWAPVNLILTLIGAICVVGMLLRWIFASQNRKLVFEYDETEWDEYHIKGDPDTSEEDAYTKGFTWTILAIIMEALSALLFISTEDIRTRMVLADRFTLPALILLLIEIAFLVFAARTLRKIAEEENKQIKYKESINL
jgi:hypothetical protein